MQLEYLQYKKMRSTPSNNITLDSLIGRLTAIELSNSDNYSPASIEFEIKAQLNLDGSNKKKKRQYIESGNQFDDYL